MHSDDDFVSFSPPEEPWPPAGHRRLKRLKKAIRASIDSDSPSNPVDYDKFPFPQVYLDRSEELEASGALGSDNSNEPLPVEEDDILPLPQVNFAKSEELVASGALGSEYLSEPGRLSQSLSEDLVRENDELSSGFDSVRFDEDPKETKRALESDDYTADGFDARVDKSVGVEADSEGLKAERSEKKRINEGELIDKEKKKKKKVDKFVDVNNSKPNKRQEEKERKAYLQQLHAESQRLLRETRDAAFKPIPVVQKPISSVLEKIRKRKLEVSKKSITSYSCSIDKDDIASLEAKNNLDSENVCVEAGVVDKLDKIVEEQTVECQTDAKGAFDATKALDGESTPAFRAPLDDTQDLFSDSQTSGSIDKPGNDQDKDPLEEVMAQPLRTMNLNFDSVRLDDNSSDERDNDKENINLHGTIDGKCSSPSGDPVKAFVDDEAVEEDDSDHDLGRFQENEDEYNEDSEELNDMIAPESEEWPVDNEMRNQMHQNWLEQQDAFETNNLLQKYVVKNAGLTSDDEEQGDDEHEEEMDDEIEEGPPKSSAQINSRKVKQMFSQMFHDKDDMYSSASDDENTNKKNDELKAKRLAHMIYEDKTTLLSPAEDENSREFFSLIKKLNVAPDTRRKSKTTSFFDNVLKGRNSSSSSKSSFLGRASNSSIQTSHKQGSSMVRSFVFGRDDSSSRSSLSLSEDSLNTVISRENQPTRNVRTKFTYSQARSSSRTDAAAETSTSLFEILKHSSKQSNVDNQDSICGLTQTVFAAFKIPNNTMKVEGTNLRRS